MFRSFFMAGFECATGANCRMEKIDQVAATGHDRRLAEDYRMLASKGIQVVREGVRWPLVDQPSGFKFQTLHEILREAENAGIQVILDLFHYGYPDDLDIFSPRFEERFKAYCAAVADIAKNYPEVAVAFTPVNEPSYLAWAAGDAARFRPHETGRSFELKVRLIQAAIQGMNEIMKLLPRARFVNADPLCRVAVPRGRPDLADQVRDFNENVVFQSWDMLAGRLMPELGGSPRHLDIVGVNYYWTNQWEHLRPERILSARDPRSWPLRDLLRWVWYRYHHEMIVTETSHVGRRRGRWIRDVADEAEAVLNEGIPLRGICLYPVLGMPEWHDQTVWTKMGLWDLDTATPDLKRLPHRASLAALSAAQQRLEGLNLERPQKRYVS